MLIFPLTGNRNLYTPVFGGALSTALFYYTRKKTFCKRFFSVLHVFLPFFRNFFDRRFMLRPREQSPYVFVMCAPRENVDDHEQQQRASKRRVLLQTVTRQVNSALPKRKSARTDQRPHRAPLRPKNIQRDENEKAKPDEHEPSVFARQTQPKST